MFRLVIIEDEEVIRKGLQTTIDWQSLGFTVVGDACNGSEALRRMPQWQPDAVLTDIQMPDVDGLEMLQNLKKLSPAVEVVLLSGHAKFSYVQKGLSLDAFAYILKVDLYDEVEDVFTRLRQKLSAAKNVVKEAGNADLKNWLHDSHIPSRLPPGLCSFRVWVISGEAAGLPRELPQTTDVFWKCAKGKNQVVLQMSAVLREEEARTGRAAVCSKIYHEPGRVPQAFEEALLLLERQEIQPALREPCPMPDLAQLWKWALTLEREAFQEALYQSFLSCLMQEEQPGGLSEYRNRLLRTAEMLASMAGEENWTELAAEMIGKTVNSPSYLEIAETVCRYDVELYNKMRTRRKHSANYIQDACEFISKNLSLELGLSEICQYFYLSPSYFSYLFKQETGKSYSLYVQEQRIKRAAALSVSSKLRNQEIAQLCGFKDEHYLARVFKAYYGTTISEYRHSEKRAES